MEVELSGSNMKLILYGELKPHEVKPIVEPVVEPKPEQEKLPRVTKSYPNPWRPKKDISKDLLEIVRQNPICKAGKINHELHKRGIDISRHKILFDLYDLVDKGLIIKQGDGSGRTYSIAGDITEPLKTEGVLKAEPIENRHVAEDDIKGALKILGKGTLREVLTRLYGKEVSSTSYEYARVNTLLVRMSKGPEAILNTEESEGGGKRAFIYSLKPEVQKTESPQVDTGLEEYPGESKILDIVSKEHPVNRRGVQLRLNESGIEADATNLLPYMIKKGRIEKFGTGKGTMYVLKGFNEKLKNGKVYPIHGKMEKSKEEIDKENARKELDDKILEMIGESQPLSRADIMEGIEQAHMDASMHMERLKSLVNEKKIERIGAGPGTRYVLAGYEEEKEESEDEDIEEELGLAEPQEDEESEESEPAPGKAEIAVPKLPPEPDRNQPERTVNEVVGAYEGSFFRHYPHNRAARKEREEQKERQLAEQDKRHNDIDVCELCEYLKGKMETSQPITAEELETAGLAADATDLWVQLVDNHSPLRSKINRVMGFRVMIYETNDGLIVGEA